MNEINSEMLKTFREEGIEDTPTNRLSFLMGLVDAWEEDTSSNPLKKLYVWRVKSEIHRLRLILS